MLISADSAPTMLGVNVTVIVQLPPGSTMPQVFICAKSGALVPVTVMLVMVRFEPPVFVSVTLIADEVVPTVWAGNVREVGDRVTVGVDVTPVPVSATGPGFSGAVVISCRDADSGPTVEGLNVTGTVQVPPARMDAHPLLIVAAKSPAFVPVIETFVTEIVDDEPFVTVRFIAGLVTPSTTFPKASAVGMTVTGDVFTSATNASSGPPSVVQH